VDRNRKAPDYVNRTLRRFGLNPWGEPLYRVVWSESRWKWVGGEFHDGFRVVREYRQVPMYRSTARWILEVWKPTPVSPEQWARDEYCPISGLMKSGPYPYKGEYWGSITVEGLKKEYLEISPGIVKFFADLISKSTGVTPWEAFVAKRDAVEAEQKALSKLRRAIISDAISAFGNSSYSGAHGKSKEKTKNYLGKAMQMPGFGQMQPHLIDPTKPH